MIRVIIDKKTRSLPLYHSEEMRLAARAWFVKIAIL